MDEGCGRDPVWGAEGESEGSRNSQAKGPHPDSPWKINPNNGVRMEP